MRLNLNMLWFRILDSNLIGNTNNVRKSVPNE